MNVKMRTHGTAPYRVAVIHGGPGAAGEMAPVARRLASLTGILEPLQTAGTVDGQVHELRALLENGGALPVTLIGFSWGAWLGFILAARHPHAVGRLVLVGAGPFEQQYVPLLAQTRAARLSEGERAEYDDILRRLGGSPGGDSDVLSTRLGALTSRTDSYDPLPLPPDPDPIEVRGELFRTVWEEAAAMRSSGELLALGRHIRCPVTAIHGDHDPHPAEGVRRPLAAVLDRFRFILLEKCGHKPWIERQAGDAFYRALEEELKNSFRKDRPEGNATTG
ncbi:MAG: alpha/beta hydrolase [Candidatus Eisenbacteria bacterium]